MTRTDMVYRKTAIEGASGFGLLIALYDTLAGNLRRAAEAQRSNNIEQRCLEIKHAFVVIGYLENSLQNSPGGALTQQLSSFYSSLRRSLMVAQVEQSAETLEREMASVLKVREYWQQVEVQGAAPQPASAQSQLMSSLSAYPGMRAESRYGGWSV